MGRAGGATFFSNASTLCCALHVVEVVVDVLAEFRIGLIQVQREGLQLVVAPRLLVGFRFLLLPQLGLVVFVLALGDAGDL